MSDKNIISSCKTCNYPESYTNWERAYLTFLLAEGKIMCRLTHVSFGEFCVALSAMCRIIVCMPRCECDRPSSPSSAAHPVASVSSHPQPTCHRLSCETWPNLVPDTAWSNTGRTGIWSSGESYDCISNSCHKTWCWRWTCQTLLLTLPALQ